MEDWAEEAGLGTIDVARAFLEQDDLEALPADQLHPNQEGQQLWADTVGQALAS